MARRALRYWTNCARAVSGRFQLTTDGLRAYTLNVPFVFGTQADFAQLIKNYASTQSGNPLLAGHDNKRRESAAVWQPG